MAGGTLTPLAPLTMQELKLSQTLDGANMSPYHTTGEFATSLVLLQSRQVMYTCFAEYKVLLSLSQIWACVQLICPHLKCVLLCRVVYGVNLPRDQARCLPFSIKILLISTSHSYLSTKTYTRNTFQMFSAKS